MAGPASYHPQVPYVGNLPGGLTSKKTVVVKGFVPQNAKSFCINFKTGHSQDIALHINPRLNEQKVVRNSFLKGQWGSEERELSFNPFQPGQYFDVSKLLIVATKEYKVCGQHYYEFRHRLPPTHVRFLEVDGDVKLEIFKSGCLKFNFPRRYCDIPHRTYTHVV
uniref:Galectin n=1 Tax=Pelusios castaneus TaxID=367368 RepID=A0A8C8RVX7_9SAUR